MSLPPSQTPYLFHTFPVMAIAIIAILATAFLLVAYYVFVIKCCLNWHHRRRLHTPTDLDVQKTGLDQAVIRSIPVIKFRKLSDTEMTETNKSYECAVCLSEFQDGEKLRVIPNCCHAFHIDCIDVWLQNTANCPLCRSGISPSSIVYGVPPPENNDVIANDNGNDYVVIEIQGNNLDEARMIRSEPEAISNTKGRKIEHSIGDEWISMREKDKEFGDVEPIRRSISMDWSKEREFCLEIQQDCCNISSSSSSSGRVRRSIFSFGYGRSSNSSKLSC